MKPRIVATFTTLPDRYAILEQSLLSIKNQTLPPDVIYLTLPRICKRLNKEYPDLPETILKMVTLIQSDIDYGPITKIYGALMEESQPETIFLSFDDDIIYPPTLIEKLVAHSLAYPDSAICATGALLDQGNLLFSSIYSTLKHAHGWNSIIGFPIPPEGRNIDLVFGVAGVLYRRGFFPPSKSEKMNDFLAYALQDHNIFCNDDMLISGYLAQQNIKRRIFADLPLIEPKNGSPDSLSHNLFEMVPRATKAFAALRARTLFMNMEPLEFSETPAYRIIILFLIILLFTIFFIMMFYLSVKK